MNSTPVLRLGFVSLSKGGLFPMVSLMKDQFSMFELMNCADLPSAISSQELAGGLTPCALQGGPMTGQCGLDHRPVSLSAQPESNWGKATKDTSPPILSAWSGQPAPPVLFGEQVASSAVFGKPAKPPKRGTASAPEWAWIDDLSDRLEAARYAVGASDIPAAGIGAPHIRQRTFFGAIRLADPHHAGPQGHGREPREQQYPQGREVSAGYGSTLGGSDGLADADNAGSLPSAQRGIHRGEEGPRAWNVEPERSGCSSVLADSSDDGRGEGRERVTQTGNDGPVGNGGLAAGRSSTCAPESVWRDADWLFCRDGKWRPVIAGTSPLAHGIPARVVRLRGYGNAIVPQVAAEFIQAFKESTEGASQ